MTHHTDHMLEVAKGLIAIVGSGGLFLLDTIAQVTSGLPEWVNSFGLPIAMLFASMYGIVKLFQALLAERNARIVDRDAVIAMQKQEAEANRQLHERILTMGHEQNTILHGIKESNEAMMRQMEILIRQK